MRRYDRQERGATAQPVSQSSLPRDPWKFPPGEKRESSYLVSAKTWHSQRPGDPGVAQIVMGQSLTSSTYNTR